MNEQKRLHETGEAHNRNPNTTPLRPISARKKILHDRIPLLKVLLWEKINGCHSEKADLQTDKNFTSAKIGAIAAIQRHSYRLRYKYKSFPRAL